MWIGDTVMTPTITAWDSIMAMSAIEATGWARTRPASARLGSLTPFDPDSAATTCSGSGRSRRERLIAAARKSPSASAYGSANPLSPSVSAKKLFSPSATVGPSTDPTVLAHSTRLIERARFSSVARSAPA